jgi:hypothetical protein
MSSILAPIYRAAFYVLSIGILFDVFTRFNYLTADSASGIGTGSIELGVLVAAWAVVLLAKAQRGVISDSLRVLEAESETGRLRIASCPFCVAIRLLPAAPWQTAGRPRHIGIAGSAGPARFLPV